LLVGEEARRGVQKDRAGFLEKKEKIIVRMVRESFAGSRGKKRETTRESLISGKVTQRGVESKSETYYFT